MVVFMKRVHLFELTDQAWCPTFLRQGLTEYLEQTQRLESPYTVVLPRLLRALRETGTHQVIDLGSGSGGPWPALLQAADLQTYGVRVCLTDTYPHTVAFVEEYDAALSELTYYADPVDARNVPPDLQGFRTMFAGFHHFRPADAQRILADAIVQRQGIAIFEATRRSIPALSLMLLIPLFVNSLTPLMRPFRWSRLFWTYLVPVIPLGVLFDGVVSCLRTYTLAELRAMVENLDAPGYVWEIGEEPLGRSPLTVSYLIGYPSSRLQAGHSASSST